MVSLEGPPGELKPTATAGPPAGSGRQPMPIPQAMAGRASAFGGIDREHASGAGEGAARATERASARCPAGKTPTLPIGSSKPKTGTDNHGIPVTTLDIHTRVPYRVPTRRYLKTDIRGPKNGQGSRGGPPRDAARTGRGREQSHRDGTPPAIRIAPATLAAAVAGPPWRAASRSPIHGSHRKRRSHR